MYVSCGRHCASTCWPGWETEMASDVIAGKARGFPQKYNILADFLNRGKATNRNLKEMLYTVRNNRKEGRFFLYYFHTCQFSGHAQSTFGFLDSAWPNPCLFLGGFLYRAVGKCSDIRSNLLPPASGWLIRVEMDAELFGWFVWLPLLSADLRVSNHQTTKGGLQADQSHLSTCSLQAYKMVVIGLVKALAYSSPIPPIVYISSNFL